MFIAYLNYGHLSLPNSLKGVACFGAARDTNVKELRDVEIT